MQQLNARIYVETGYTGCNVGWIKTNEGVVLIDTPALPQDIADLKTKINVNDIAYTVFTHEHFDHTLGAADFGKRIISHEKVIPELVRLQTALPQDVSYFFAELYKQYKDYFDNIKFQFPQITFQNSLKFHIGGVELELWWVGGHSPASSFVYLPQDEILFCGDTTNHGMPYVTPLSIFGEWITLLQQIEALPVKTIIPGHGDICTKAEARQIRLYFEGLRGNVAILKKSGKDLDETIRELNAAAYLPVPLTEAIRPQIAYHAGLMYAQV